MKSKNISIFGSHIMHFYWIAVGFYQLRLEQTSVNIAVGDIFSLCLEKIKIKEMRSKISFTSFEKNTNKLNLQSIRKFAIKLLRVAFS